MMVNKLLLKRVVSRISESRVRPRLGQIYLVLLLILFKQSNAMAQNSVATIVRATNASTIISPNGDSRVAAVRQNIYAGDSVETSENAWLILNFFDLTRIVLRPNSRLTIRRFPETVSGGMRVTTGTMAAKYPDSFSVVTPNGELSGGRSEWVLRICEDDDCEALGQTFDRCQDSQHIEKIDKQFLVVYKGVVNYPQCRVQPELNPGETTVYDPSTERCEVIDEVPCFILFDQNLGQDKIRIFRPDFSPILTVPDVQRPQRPNNRRLPPPGARPPRPRRAPRR